MTFTYQIILQIIMLINLTLIGGILPLIERKYLSLIQRRVGPKFVGYKGRLQFIADALKMFLKGVFVPKHVNTLFFLFWPICFLSIVYTLHLNIY
jgi:NADH-quinone oxidoreductase subunit H